MTPRSELDTNAFEPLTCAATPSGTLPSKRKPLRDEREVEGFDEEDDSDLGLSDLDDEESIGLDTATGFEDANDDLELSDDGEGQRWSTDSEEASELPGDDADLFPGEEYGWLGDDEPSDDDDGAFDAEFADEDLAPRDDGGEEGLEDDDLDELVLGDLPEMDADVEEDSSGQGDLFEELAGMSLVEEPTLEVAAGEHWKVLPAGSARVRILATLATPATTLLASGSALYLAAGGLSSVDLESGASSPLPLMAAGVSALAATEHDGVLHLAAVADGKLFVSSDGGKSFLVSPSAERVVEVGFTRAGARPRLWCLNERGVLGSSDGVADIDGDVFALHTDGQRRIVALARVRDAVVLAMSTDAGKTFALHDAPLGAADPSTRLSVCRGAVLLANDSGVQVAFVPMPFEEVSVLCRGPATLSNEDDEAFVYACVQRDAELLIVRRAARASGFSPTVIASIGSELGGEPRVLRASYAEGGSITLFVALESALLRIDASLDGEELA